MVKKIYKYTFLVKPHRCKKSGKTKKARYVDRKGEITGELRIVRGWHGIGQGVSEVLIA